MTNKTVNLQKYTRLPLQIVNVATKMLPSVFIITPHNGTVEIKLKETHYPFIFGSVTQPDKSAQQIIVQIKNIEDEAIEYLIGEWKKTL